MSSVDSAANKLPAATGTPLAIGLLVTFASVLTLILALLGLDGPQHGPLGGLRFGTVIAHALLSSAWFALRTDELQTRFIGWAMWSAAVLVPFSLTGARATRSPEEFVFAFVVGVPLLFVLQVVITVPPFLLVRWFGFTLRRGTATDGKGRWQFGIRRLLGVTTAVGLILGVARYVVYAGQVDYREVVLACAVVLAAALLFLATLVRDRIAGTVFVAALFAVIALVAVCYYVFSEAAVTFATMTIWMLLCGGTFRAAGYRLARATET